MIGPITTMTAAMVSQCHGLAPSPVHESCSACTLGGKNPPKSTTRSGRNGRGAYTPPKNSVGMKNTNPTVVAARPFGTSAASSRPRVSSADRPSRNDTMKSTGWAGMGTSNASPPTSNSNTNAVTAAASWVSSCAPISMIGETGVVDSRLSTPFSR